MGTINFSLPADGTSADVADYNTPLNTIKNEFNGNIDDSNIKTAAAIAGSKIASGSIAWDRMAGLGVQRQDNTTNTSVAAAKVQCGWGVITNNTGAASIEETVTFPVAFTGSRPIVLIISGGDHGSSTTYGDGGSVVEARIIAKAHTISLTTFVAQLTTESAANNFNAGNSFYQWIAIGT